MFSEKGRAAPDHLNMDQSVMIRGAACLGIILHHLTQQVTVYGRIYKGPVTLFNYAGILFTGLFFFFSGYGLITRYNTSAGYMDSFLKNRLPRVLIPFWIINFLEILSEYFVYGIHKSARAWLCDLTGITLVNSNGWFIIEIVILYLAFYVLFRWVRHKDAALILLCTFTVLLIIYSFFQGHDPEGSKAHWFRGEWWFNSTGVFIAGLLYARFRKRLDAFVNRHYPPVLIAAVLLSGILFGAAIYAVDHLGYYHDPSSRFAEQDKMITLLLQTSASVLFTMTAVFLNMRVTLRSRVLRYIGGISMELFLIHGYFVNRIFGNVRMSDPLRFAAVLGCSTASAAVISPFVKWIVRKVLQLFSRQRGSNHTLESEIAEQKRNRRNRIIRRITAAGVCMLCLFLMYRAAWSFVFARSEYEKECDAIRAADVGSEVLWGHYETDPARFGKERLTWIVIRKEEDRVCLLSKEGIAGSFYNRKHEAVSWEESDLRELLNSDAFTDMFSRYEAQSVINVDGDLISLLTPQEAEVVFQSDEERELVITSKAEQNGTNVNTLSKDHYWDMKGYRSSWWWLRGESGNRAITAPIVTVDGTVSLEEKYVNKPGGAIRPVIWVECSDSAR